MENEMMPVPSVNVTHSKSKIEHLRDLFHSDDVAGAYQKSLNFSKYNIIGPDSVLKKCAFKISGMSGGNEATFPNQEYPLSLEQFVFVMPPGTMFGTVGDLQEVFSQRIKNWNMCLNNASTETFSDKWVDILTNMAIDNVSPFSVYLKLFLKTTHYFIAMSKIGVHIYRTEGPSVQIVDEVLELEDIIIAKLNGSREDQIELRDIITEILFDSATQNIHHPGIEVERHEEGEFLLVTLKLKTAVEPSCGEQSLVHPSKVDETKQSESIEKQNAVDTRCSLQGNETGQKILVLKLSEDANCSSTQVDNFDVCNNPQLSKEKECAKQGEREEEVAKNSCITFPSEQGLYVPIKNTPDKTDSAIQISGNKECTSHESESLLSDVATLECTVEQTDKSQAHERGEKPPHNAGQEPSETGQKQILEPGNISSQGLNKDGSEFDGVELCMTVDAASDEDGHSEASSNEQDEDMSILCDVEMYSATSPGHSAWSDNEADEPNITESESTEVHSQMGTKATVLSENTNLGDNDLTCAIQNRFKNIRVYKNNKRNAAKTKENKNNCDKENSEGLELPGKPDSGTNNIDAASISCTSQEVNHVDYVPCHKSKLFECQMFIDNVRRKKLKLMQIDPTVDLNCDNVYVMFKKKLIRASLGTNGNMLPNLIYCCGLCNNKFGNYKDLISHTKSHNANKVITVTVYVPKTKKEVTTREKCKECGHACAENGECTREDEFLCEVCGERFHSRRRLSKHHKSRHLPPKPQKPGLCHTCGTRFSTVSALRRHNDVRHADASVTCDDCGKTFKTKSQIARHVRIHLGLKPYECIACGMRFGVKMRWREHMYLHTGLKPYNCDICLQDFRHMSALSLHKKMHRQGKI